MKTNLFEIPTTGFFSKPQIRRILKAARGIFPLTYFSPPTEDSITLVFPEPVSAPEFLNEALGLCRVHEFTYIGDPRLTMVCPPCRRQRYEWKELYVPAPPIPDPELDILILTKEDFLIGELANLGALP